MRLLAVRLKNGLSKYLISVCVCDKIEKKKSPKHENEVDNFNGNIVSRNKLNWQSR